LGKRKGCSIEQPSLVPSLQMAFSLRLNAVNRAEEEAKSLGDPLDMFNHAYAELPPHLIDQRNALARELEDIQGEESHG